MCVCLHFIPKNHVGNIQASCLLKLEEIVVGRNKYRILLGNEIFVLEVSNSENFRHVLS